MNLIELLNNEILRIPKDWNNNKANDYFPEYISNIFEDYLELLKNFDENNIKELIDYDTIKKLAKQINLSINNYYNGTPHKSFIELDRGLKIVLKHMKNLFLTYSDVYFYDKSENPLNELYRMRYSKEKLVTPEEMFHVPFEERIKIKQYRYSISGYPCLYIGQSLDVCYKELGKKRNNEEVYYSKFSQQKTSVIHILDFGYTANTLKKTLSDIEKEIEKYKTWWKNNKNPNLSKHSYELKLRYLSNYKEAVEDYILSFLMCFPLIMSCSIKTKNNNNNNYFIPEYIVPQLLLEWIKESPNFDGIRYISTKIDIDDRKNCFDFFKYWNYVFPPKKSKENGYDEDLMKILKNEKPKKAKK